MGGRVQISLGLSNYKAKLVSKRVGPIRSPLQCRACSRRSAGLGCVLLCKEQNLKEWRVLCHRGHSHPQESCPARCFPPPFLTAPPVHMTSFRILQKLEMAIEQQLSEWWHNRFTESYVAIQSGHPEAKRTEKY